MTEIQSYTFLPDIQYTDQRAVLPIFNLKFNYNVAIANQNLPTASSPRMFAAIYGDFTRHRVETKGKQMALLSQIYEMFL
jgi:hypothetical protein